MRVMQICQLTLTWPAS